MKSVMATAFLKKRNIPFNDTIIFLNLLQQDVYTCNKIVNKIKIIHKTGKLVNKSKFTSGRKNEGQSVFALLLRFYSEKTGHGFMSEFSCVTLSAYS